MSPNERMAAAMRGAVAGPTPTATTAAAPAAAAPAAAAAAPKSTKPKGLFDASAVTAVLKWRFKPKTVDGKAVEQRGVQKIEFTINK